MIKPSGQYFYKRDGWASGQQVRCVATDTSSYEEDKIYTLTDSFDYERVCIAASIPFSGENGEFELVGSKGKGFAKWIKGVENV